MLTTNLSAQSDNNYHIKFCVIQTNLLMFDVAVNTATFYSIKTNKYFVYQKTYLISHNKVYLFVKL